MKANHPVGSGALVKAIYILSYKAERVDSLTPSGEYVMSSVGLGGDDAFAAPSVPFPDEDGIGIESIECGEILRSIFLPESFLATKRWDAASSGDAGTRKNAYT